MKTEELLHQSCEALMRQVASHRDLVHRALQPEGDEHKVTLCGSADCPHRRQLRQALKETIAVLEGTRKAFKSRQLEQLRLKLLAVLADET